MTHSTITSKGQTTAFIKDKLRDAATDDAVDKEALNLALSFLQSLANQQLKLPESGIAKKIESGSGKLSKGLKLARIIRGEEQRPLEDAEFARLARSGGARTFRPHPRPPANCIERDQLHARQQDRIWI